jgi:nitroreductase
MDVIDAIKNRRSIRRYQPAAVDDKTVQTVLEAAHWAPSWGNIQCWRFIVVRSAEVKAKVADTLMKTMVDGELVINAAASAIKQAPVLIVLCAELGKAGYQPDGSPATDKGEYWYLFDVGLAMENLALAAYSLGLGTVIVGGFDSKKVSSILDIPAGYAVVTMTPLGYPDHKGQVSPRKDLSSVIYRDKYGK